MFFNIVGGVLKVIGALTLVPVFVYWIDSIQYNPFTGKPVCRCSWGEGRKGTGRWPRKHARVFLWDANCPKHREPPERAWRDDPLHDYRSLQTRIDQRDRRYGR